MPDQAESCEKPLGRRYWIRRTRVKWLFFAGRKGTATAHHGVDASARPVGVEFICVEPTITQNSALFLALEARRANGARKPRFPGMRSLAARLSRRSPEAVRRNREWPPVWQSRGNAAWQPPKGLSS
jgi:hypothetical protein